MIKQKHKLFFVFIFLVVLLRLPSIDAPLDTDSSANAFFARQIIRGEVLYDKFHTGHHLPGIYYTFLIAFKLFGDNAISPKVLLFPFIFASAWLIFLIGQSLFNEIVGVLGGFFFILISSQKNIAGLTTEMELFANLPIILTIYLLFKFIKTNAPIQFIWLGIISSICILYKITFVSPLIVSCISILCIAWLKPISLDSYKQIYFCFLWLLVGFLSPLLLVAGYFAYLGLFDRLLLVFTFGFSYFDNVGLIPVTFPRPFGFPLFILSYNNIALLIFGLFGSFRLLYRSFPFRSLKEVSFFLIVIWFIVSLVLTGLRGGGFLHYVLIATPPLALLAGIEISSIFHVLNNRFNRKSAVVGGGGVLVLLIFVNFLFSNSEPYRVFFLYKTKQISYSQFVYEFTGENQLLLADYIKTNTTIDDYIYIWSINIQTYYYADRTPPIDILWPSYVSATGSPERIFNPRTKYIIVDNPKFFSRPQWLIDGLTMYYDLETVIDNKEIYRRKTP